MKVLRASWNAVLLGFFLICLSGFSHAGDVALSKPTINFGNVVMGSSTVMVERIFNRTSAGISVASVSVVEGSSFQLSNANFPVTIPSGQEADVYITFVPDVVGAIYGSLQISPTASAPIIVPLNGTGISSGLLSATPASINFAGTSPSQAVTETLTNSGGTLVTINAINSTGSGFVLTSSPLPIMLRPGQSTAITVTPSANSATSGSINVSARVAWWSYGERGAYVSPNREATSSILQIPVSGSTVQSGVLSATPSSLNFGNMPVGNTASQSATLTNSGAGPVTITQASVSGSGFSISGLPLPMTLTAGESVSFPASFSPQSAGAVQGGISIISNATDSNLNLSLAGSGNAAGQLNLSPASLTFGNVIVGKSQTLTATLSANGSKVTVSSAAVSNSEFSVSGLQLPITIPAGQSVSYAVTFAPQSSGAAAANISFASNASAPTSSEVLSGAGSPPPTHSVALSWSADSSSVAGYNVYRGSQTGGPYTKVNPALSPATTYGDTAVTAGQTYFYVTTAVDAAGNESSHSNEVAAVIPSP